MSYTPREGSVPWKVIEFLTTNPDEELSSNEISAKFDVPAKNIHTQLALAIQHGALKRVEMDDELVYRLGTGSPVIKPKKATNPSLHGQASTWMTPPAKARRTVRSLPPLDINTIEIRYDVPIPAGKGAPALDFKPLFSRMREGGSCEIPVAFKYLLAKACTEFKKAGSGEMSVRHLSDEKLGLWRVK